MHNICTASAWIRPICMLCGSQALLLKRQRGNMHIDKDYGLPIELVRNWKKKNSWIYDSSQYNRKISIIIISFLLITFLSMMSIMAFVEFANQKKLLIYGSVIISIVFFLVYKYIDFQRNNLVKQTIQSDWLDIRNLIVTEKAFTGYLMPGDDSFEGVSFNVLKGQFIEKLRALVKASEIGGCHEDDIRELIDDVEMFFGNIGLGSLYHFNKLTYESEVVYEGKRFSCTYYQITNSVSLGDLCAFLSRNNGVICEGDTKRELPWCIPEYFIPYRKVYMVSTCREFDGFALIKIHAQYRQGDGVGICMPNELEEEGFKSSCAGMVFVRLERMKPNI